MAFTQEETMRMTSITVRRRHLARIVLALVFSFALPECFLTLFLSPQPIRAQGTIEEAETDPKDDPWLPIREAVDRGDLGAAAEIAQQRFDATEPAMDDAAKWAIALSKLRGEMLMRSPVTQEESLAKGAVAPIDQILSAYPNHRYAAWLRFQRLAIDASVARRRGLVIQASPGDDSLRLAALASLIKTDRELIDLQTEVVQSIAQAFARPDATAKDPAWIDRLMVLRNWIATQRVGVLLARGELFPTDSDDYLAAAEQANRAAIEALAMVRDNPDVLAELTIMRCDALIRTGQSDEAARLILPLVTGTTEPVAGVASGQENPARAELSLSPAAIDDNARAMAVRIAIQQNRVDTAQRLLEAHYGGQPAVAPTAPESDLARLRWLIATGSDQVGRWIETISKRGGDFQFRRAQMIAIELLGPDAAKSNDSSLVMAEAAVRLKKGNLAGAAELLETFIAATDDAASAIKAAKVAAAAHNREGRAMMAAKVLADTADRFPKNDDAAALMLQSAVLLDQAGNAPETERTLQQLTKRWPLDRNATLAHQWLAQRSEMNTTILDAAIVATPDPTTDAGVTETINRPGVETGSHNAARLQFYDQSWQNALRIWLRAFAQVAAFEPSMQVSQAYRDLQSQLVQRLANSKSEPALRARKILSTLYLDPDTLQTPGFRIISLDDQPLVQWLYSVRTGGHASPNSTTVVPPTDEDKTLRIAAATRLVLDGQNDPAIRPTLGDAIIECVGEIDQGTLMHAQALIWTGQWQSASPLLDAWIADMQEAEKSESASMQAARLFTQSQIDAARKTGLERLIQLSKRTPPQSPRWHEIQLATIETLNAVGRGDEAKRLAKYILISRPPSGQDVREAYGRWAR